MENNDYQYQPLQSPKSIRVLRLFGGSGDDLVAELIETALGDKGSVPYEAISYVWGSATKSHLLRLLGVRTLKITASLYSALRNIRHAGTEDGIRTLWADGVCINQQDVEERSCQVQLMAEIYRSASRVITYVGNDTDNIKPAIDLAKRLILCSIELRATWTKIRVTPSSAAPYHTKYRLPSDGDPAWLPLRNFLGRPWYTRMWIVQESLLNKNVLMMCGKVEIPWWLFTAFSRMQETSAYLNQYIAVTSTSERQIGAMGMMAGLRLEYEVQPQSLSLLTYLARCRDLDCGDPRDRVFALSSLVQDAKIIPDYKKPMARVFTEVAAQLLRSPEGTMVLSYTSIVRDPQVPSWAPDWSVPMAQIPIFQCQMFDASGDVITFPTPPIKDIDISCGTLRLSGIIHDRIVHVTDTLRRVFVTARLARYAWARDQYLRLISGPLGTAYPGGGSYMEAFWRTLICDLDHANRFSLTSRAPASLGGDFEAYVRPDKARAKREATEYMIRYTPGFRPEPPPLDPKVIVAFERERDMPASIFGEKEGEQNVFSALRGPRNDQSDGTTYRDTILRAANVYRTFFTTEKGYIGLGLDRGMAVGDVIAFLPRTRVPFMLRPTGKKRDEYWLVADCYVHGLMYGKVFEDYLGGEGGEGFEEFTLV
ncbi:heterokaryon incompatibility protein-domain-containing protein [Diplogelasinospora grovesii]|uniref:Heterokaryon incompatibility protein-domain-containing protein n=1 Tax=Diplogelasinospora grovesii TaxID=303347 RepID=A0AAN6S3Q0_9PEZI|nr:heterokaryon incompatibility protein-domain-containing protein [Diplogelasinospora grovesii]